MNIGEIELEKRKEIGRDAVIYVSRLGGYQFTLPREVIQLENGQAPHKITVKIWIDKAEITKGDSNVR